MINVRFQVLISALIFSNKEVCAKLTSALSLSVHYLIGSCGLKLVDT